MCLSERKFDNNMRLPNGYGSVVKMSGKRRKPYMVRKTIGWHLDETKGRQIQDFQIIGYAETRAEGLRMLAEYNQNPYDVNVAKVTFSEVYERWSKYKYPISYPTPMQRATRLLTRSVVSCMTSLSARSNSVICSL